MKTAVSIPDDVFADAERLARRLKTSRSRLYALALAEFVARHSPDEVTEKLEAALREIGEEGLADDAEVVAAVTRQALRRVEW